MFRYSTSTDVVEASPTEVDLLKFLKSCIDNTEGVCNFGQMNFNVS